VPPYDEDDDVDPAPPPVRRLRGAIAAADALLVAAPEYNSSLPGQLKNALDWASRPFPDNVLRNKPAAVIGASTSVFGAVWAQAEVRKVLAAAGARVIGDELPVARAERALDGNRLADRGLEIRLIGIVKQLADDARRPARGLAAEPIPV
jgi:chromate reductase